MLGVLIFSHLKTEVLREKLDFLNLKFTFAKNQNFLRYYGNIRNVPYQLEINHKKVG